MMHTSDAAALFAAPGDEDEDIEDDIAGGGGGDELDVDGWTMGFKAGGHQSMREIRMQ